MIQSSIAAAEVVDRIVANLSANPVGVWTGSEEEERIERSYLQTLHDSYVRTVGDIQRYFSEVSLDPNQVEVIELGQYLGVVPRALAQLGYQVTGSDFPPLLASARLRESFKGSGIKLHPQDLAAPMSLVKDGSFDCVIFCETMEHLNFNPLPVIGEINRILKPNGLLYLAVPNIASLRNRLLLLWGESIHNPIADFFEQMQPVSLMGVGLHWREYTQAEVKTLLTGMGFAIHKAKYFDLLGPTTRSGLPRLTKRAIVGLFRALSSTVVVMAKKAARANPQLATNIGKGTLDRAR